MSIFVTSSQGECGRILNVKKEGIGMRGPGETEIETDRRIVREKIALLKAKIKKIDKANVCSAWQPWSTCSCGTSRATPT
jgi:50S ribosomal subunit-associated GTPase HflX